MLYKMEKQPPYTHLRQHIIKGVEMQRRKDSVIKRSLKMRYAYKWYKIKNFPYISKKRSTKKHTVVIGVGGNVGDTKRRMQKLFFFLKRGVFFDILQTSPILKNPPFGYLEQDDFFNAVTVLKTNLIPLKVLKELQRVEKKFKRVRVFKNSPRTLDLDIIFYDKITVNKPNLTIPHPKYRERDSVLLPLHSLKKG